MLSKIQKNYFALIGERKASRGQRFAKFSENKFSQFGRKKSCEINPLENLSFTFYRILKLVNNKQAY